MAAIGELTPYFSFGIIGDPQYADKASGAWNSEAVTHQTEVSIIVHAGGWKRGGARSAPQRGAR